MKRIIFPGKYNGNIPIPSSKSDGQRLLLAAAMAKGETVLHNAGDSADELAMLEAIQTLGATVTNMGNRTLHIRGIENFPAQADLNMHESGLGTRLIASMCAVHKGTYEISGSGSALGRPMDFFEKTLPKLGATVTSANGFLPLRITGPMQGKEITLDGSQSSQYLSGLLMALPLADRESRLEVTDLKSLPYIQMTLNTLAAFGIDIQHYRYEQFVIAGQQKYLSTECTAEGDWSSASYWLTASALGQNILVSGLSMQSLQADKAILQAFAEAGCITEFHDGSLRINGRHRKPFRFDATHCPDLFPALVTFAAFCEGKSTITGVHRLGHKESDRGHALKTEFGKLDVNILIEGDDMHIYGRTFIEGGRTSAHNDHRIAMCLAIAGMFCQSHIEIEGAEAVAKSYPAFWEHLDSMGYEASGQ